MDKILFKRIIIGVISALILIYVIYLFVSINFDSMQLEYANHMEVTDGINTTGFVIRNETYVTNTADGVVYYQTKDGEKILKNGIVAKVFSNEADAAAYQKISQIDDTITRLTELNKSYSKTTSGFETVSNQLNLKLEDFILSLNQKKYADLDAGLNNLIYSINERKIVTGEIANFDDTIQELKQEKETISTGRDSIAEIKAAKAGYFSTTVDGYETCYKYENVEKITATDLEAIKKINSVPDNVIGKIASDLNWYIVCKVSAQEALSLSLGPKQVTLDLPFASSESLPAEVVAINQASKEDDGVVVLKCSYISEQISKIRDETVHIGISAYEGVRVSMQALHDDYVTYEVTDEDGNTVLDKDGNAVTEKKKVQGVYVLYGNKLIFKQVSIVYSGSDFVLCDTDPEEGKILNGNTVKLYDQVVVKGGDLYDGKIIH